MSTKKIAADLWSFSGTLHRTAHRTACRCARRPPGVTPLPQVPHARQPALGSRGPPDTSSLLRCASTPAPNSCHCARLARLVRSSLVTPPVLTHPGVLAAIQLFISPLPPPPPPQPLGMCRLDDSREIQTGAEEVGKAWLRSPLLHFARPGWFCLMFYALSHREGARASMPEARSRGDSSGPGRSAVASLFPPVGRDSSPQ